MNPSRQAKIHPKLSQNQGDKPSAQNQNENIDEPKGDRENRVFKYKNGSQTLNFEFISDKRVKCATCGNQFKNILRHLQQSKCEISNIDDLGEKFKEFTKDDERRRRAVAKAKQRENNKQKVQENEKRRKADSRAHQREVDHQKVLDEQKKFQAKSIGKKREVDEQQVKVAQNRWKAKSRGNQRDADGQQVKDAQNRWKEKSMGKQRAVDGQQVKDAQNKRKEKSMSKQREVDKQQVKDAQNRRKKLSRNKRKLEDPKGLSRYEIEAQEKKRRLWSAGDRLHEFKEATQYNAIFICSCCHRRLFHSSVELITQKLKEISMRGKWGTS